MKKLLWILVIVAVVFGVWFFTKEPAQAPETLEQETSESTVEGTTGADGSRESTIEDMMPPEGASLAADASLTLGAVREFTVTGNNFAFDKTALTVKKGEAVKITFINAEGKHDWRLDEFSAGTKVLNAGEQEVITFIADKAGSFEYYCSVGSHRQMGMKGTLTVTE